MKMLKLVLQDALRSSYTKPKLLSKKNRRNLCKSLIEEEDLKDLQNFLEENGVCVRNGR